MKKIIDIDIGIHEEIIIHVYSKEQLQDRLTIRRYPAQLEITKVIGQAFAQEFIEYKGE